MQYVKLGNTGLDISRLCVGCMSFGLPDRGDHSWTIGEERAREIIKAALEAGLNFFDNANVYSDGTAEEVLGRAVKDFSRREDVVIATKVFGRMRPGPNGGGLSRRHIFEQIDASLTRLGTDYVDLYQIHRWDAETPLEETLEALDDLVRMGKVRYIGASSMFAWQFAKAIFTQQREGWARFVTMQDHYNLLYREEEREMIPLCLDQKIGLMPWSPLARGRLARPWGTTTNRAQTDEVSRSLYADETEADRNIVDAVGVVAERHGRSRAQIAMAWLNHQPAVSTPIIGATALSHLETAIESLDIRLDNADLEQLQASYRPKPVLGHA